MDAGMTWDKPIKLHELGQGPIRLTLEPDDQQRAQIAKRLGLRGLPSLKADVTLKPWLDGVELSGRIRAVVEQVCGVSLEPFEQPLDSDIDVRAVPPGSANAAALEGGELALDPDAPDAPDLLESDSIDVAAYVIEHLALEVDPFPRKPGATFDYQPPEAETSPFAALARLKDPKP
jgi:uncharacterized metal-binding protein YceD (DUF177 family)